MSRRGHSAALIRPDLVPITEAPQLHRFENLRFADFARSIEIRDSPRDFQYRMACPGRKVQPLHCSLEGRDCGVSSRQYRSTCPGKSLRVHQCSLRCTVSLAVFSEVPFTLHAIAVSTLARTDEPDSPAGPRRRTQAWWAQRRLVCRCGRAKARRFSSYIVEALGLSKGMPCPFGPGCRRGKGSPP